MSWSTTVPTLPSGASWGGAKSTDEFIANHYKVKFTASIARISRTEIAVRVAITSREGTYGDYYPPETYYLKAGSKAASTSISWNNRSKTVYWTGEVSSSTIRIIAGVSSLSVTLDVPGQIGPDIRVMIGDSFTALEDVKIGGTSPVSTKIMNENNEWVEV